MSYRSAPEFLFPFLIKEEGSKLKAYQDSKGIWTIGVGHTGPEVQKGLTINADKVTEYLRADILIAIARLHKVVKLDVINELTDHQYAALISFVFNLGANPSWGFWKVINAKKFDEVPSYMMRFNKIVEVKDGKKVTRALLGLTRRRTSEVNLWSTPDDKAEKEVRLPSSGSLRQAETPPAPQSDAKGLGTSKTMWTGAATAVAGAAQGFAAIQDTAAPQAANNELIGKLVGLCAVAIVALGVAVMVFRWLDEKAKHL